MGVRVFCFVLLAVVQIFAQNTTTTTSDQNLPYCDEIDNHASATSPSTSGSSSGSGLNGNSSSNSSNASNDVNLIPNHAELASNAQRLLSQLGGPAVAKDQTVFGTAMSVAASQMSALSTQMNSRQEEINNIYSVVLPSLQVGLSSRRQRAVAVRSQLKALNAKLATLVDSLDRSEYIKEQQKYMTLINSLMRIQNSIALSSLNSFPTASSRTAETHPNNALLAVAQEAIPKAKAVFKDESNVLDLLHALDLLEVAATTSDVPYQNRLSMLSKKINSVVSQLISMFSDLRDKHKSFAKLNRDMWSKQLELIQSQTDALTTSLQSVMEQAEYYLRTYAKNKNRLTALIAQQADSVAALNAAQQQMLQNGLSYNELVMFRASELVKLQELLHYLTYGNTQFTADVFDFACDGVIGGSAKFDQCGVCGGTGTTCLDCLGTPNGTATVDVCGVCNGKGKSCDYFCDGQANSGQLIDLCGVCGGNSTKCLGCDGLPASGLVLDRCGICGGDGSSCNATETADQSPPVAGPQQVTVVVKLGLGVPFTPDWAINNGTALRQAIATTMNVDLRNVQITTISGVTSLILDLSIIVDGATGGDAMKELIKATSNGALVATLQSNGLNVSQVNILQGPSQLSSNL